MGDWTICVEYEIIKAPYSQSARPGQLTPLMIVCANDVCSSPPCEVACLFLFLQHFLTRAAGCPHLLPLPPSLFHCWRWVSPCDRSLKLWKPPVRLIQVAGQRALRINATVIVCGISGARGEADAQNITVLAMWMIEHPGTEDERDESHSRGGVTSDGSDPCTGAAASVGGKSAERSPFLCSSGDITGADTSEMEEGFSEWYLTQCFSKCSTWSEMQSQQIKLDKTFNDPIHRSPTYVYAHG